MANTLIDLYTIFALENSILLTLLDIMSLLPSMAHLMAITQSKEAK